MKCIQLKISNFMGIGEACLDLSDKGLVAIQGFNMDDSSANSNGAGKSSIADALFWCNYGETARDGLGADKVVNRKIGKDCEVTSVWQEADGGTYTVTRFRKKSTGSKKNGVTLSYSDPLGAGTTDLTKGTDKLTQVEIDKAIGCTEDVFAAAVYAGQEKLPNLPAMTDGELKQLIEKSSGVDVLVTAYKIARDHLKTAENNQDRWRATHVRLEREVTSAKDRLDKMISERDSYESKRASNIAILTSTLTEHIAIAKKRQAERDTVDPTRITAEVAKLDIKIEAVQAEQLEEENLLADEREATNRLTTLQAHFNRAKNDTLAQKKKLDTMADRIGQPCDECGKPCEEHDLVEVKRIAEGTLRTFAAHARELKSDMEEQEKVVARRSHAVTEHRSTRTDISATVSERKRYAELLAFHKRAEDAMTTETNAARRVKEQIDRAKTEVNPFIALVEGTESELNDAANEYRDSEAAGVAVERDIMVAKEVVKVYGPAGVRAHVLDTVTPFLNDRTADYLGVMSDGNISAVWSTLSLNAKGDLVEKFAIDVQKIGDADSFAGLSGGEKRKVRLGCALALQDLVASRANKPIELWVGDEIDDAMDDAGLERLMTVLEKKARERGTVIVISHNSLNDWIRDAAVVTRKGGLSTIDGVLSVGSSSHYVASF